MILLTNDDGIHAQGLWALYNRFVDTHHVSVVAPDRERSAIGHAITLNQPLRASRVSLNGGYSGYAVNGTPADCIKLAIAEILPERPDVVVAGINPGANVGANLNYSGTVAAAKEAALGGAIGIAASIEGRRIELFHSTQVELTWTRDNDQRMGGVAWLCNLSGEGLACRTEERVADLLWIGDRVHMDFSLAPGDPERFALEGCSAARHRPGIPAR